MRLNFIGASTYKVLLSNESSIMSLTRRHNAYNSFISWTYAICSFPFCFKEWIRSETIAPIFIETGYIWNQLPSLRKGGSFKHRSDPTGQARKASRFAENTIVNNNTIARSLVDELTTRLMYLEEIGALVAAAHIDTAIDILRRDFDLPRDGSRTD